MINPLLAQLTHQSFPQLADALRVSISAINREWDAAVRQALPQLNILTFDELKDSIPKILASVADALASSDPQEIEKLVHDAPWQGLTRFHQHYTLTEIMQEDRLLRGVVVVHIEARLGRQMNVPEAAALHATAIPHPADRCTARARLRAIHSRCHERAGRDEESPASGGEPGERVPLDHHHALMQPGALPDA